MPSTYLIIGGGIAGPVAALRLAQDGHRCTVYERAARPHTIGGAINLAPNGLRLLSRLGIGDEVRRRGCAVPAFDVRDEGGAALGSVANASRDGLFPGVRIMRSALQEVLLAEVARRSGVAVEFGRELVAVEGDGDGVVARFVDGSVAVGDYLVGADGIHSTVRGYVAADVTPEYTRQSLVYGILPTKDLPDVDFAAMPPTCAVFARRGFFAAAFTDESRSCLYWIAAKTKEVAERSSDVEKIRAEEYERFKQLYEPLPQIIAATNEFFSWPVYELPELERWYKGRVVLVGDAAHALPPNMGQGVSQAIEDVFMLARVVSHSRGFDRYEELRKPRIAKLRATIRKQTREQERGPWSQWLMTWGFWAFLKAVAVLNLFMAWDDFAYDPDTIKI